MKFGSWTFKGKTLVYGFYEDKKNLILNDTMINGAWDIISTEGNITEVHNPASNEVNFYQMLTRLLCADSCVCFLFMRTPLR